MIQITLAADLGRAPGAAILRSDEIRKRRHGVVPETRLPPDAYAPDAYTDDVSMAVFATLSEQAHTIADGGQAAIADATFLDPAHRQAIAATAQSASVPFLGLWLTAPMPTLEGRVTARTHDAADATVAVLRAAAARGHAPADWRIIDTRDTEAALRQEREFIRAATALC